MKAPTFLEGVGVALTASVVGSVLFTTLAPVFGSATVVRALIAAIGLAYVLYLLRRSRERIGRVTVVAGWAVAAFAIGLWQPPLLLYLLLHIALLWLVRSLYRYASLLSALADLGLSGLGLAAAVWAAVHTGSLFLSIWSFFLVQALCVAIPRDLRGRRAASPDGTQPEDRFQTAYRAAQAALRRLSSVQ